MHCIKLFHASFAFEGNYNFRLSGGLTAYLMTFSQGLSLCKPQLFAESLDLVIIGAYAIPLPTEPLYCLHEGDHWDNKRPF